MKKVLVKVLRPEGAEKLGGKLGYIISGALTPKMSNAFLKVILDFSTKISLALFFLIVI